MTKVPTFLETGRLSIRELTPHDAQSLFRITSEGEAQRWADISSLKDAEAAINRALTAQENPQRGRYDLAIVLKSTGDLIGACEVGFNFGSTEAEFGIVIGRDYRRQGYAREALTALLRFGFDTLGLKEMYGYSDLDNAAIRELASAETAVGQERMVVEDHSTGRSRDAIRYSVTAIDWQALAGGHRSD